MDIWKWNILWQRKTDYGFIFHVIWETMPCKFTRAYWINRHMMKWKDCLFFCNEIDICTAKCDIFCKDMHMLINGSVFLSRVKSKVFSSMPIEVLQ